VRNYLEFTQVCILVGDTCCDHCWSGTDIVNLHLRMTKHYCIKDP